jgi:hypothetical protein
MNIDITEKQIDLLKAYFTQHPGTEKINMTLVAFVNHGAPSLVVEPTPKQQKNMTLIINKEELEKLTTYFKNNPEVSGLEVKIEEKDLCSAEANAITIEDCSCGVCEPCITRAETRETAIPQDALNVLTDVERLRREGSELGNFFV